MHFTQAVGVAQTQERLRRASRQGWSVLQGPAWSCVCVSVCVCMFFSLNVSCATSVCGFINVRGWAYLQDSLSLVGMISSMLLCELCLRGFARDAGCVGIVLLWQGEEDLLETIWTTGEPVRHPCSLWSFIDTLSLGC